MRFDAFVSYSQEADSKIALALLDELERVARPWYRRRALRVFLDNRNLAAVPDLWRAIEERLLASKWLVLMASKEAAMSAWVQREVDWWLANRTLNTVMLIVTSGTVVWDSNGVDFDWGRTDALPLALKGRYSSPPRFVDLRWTRSASDGLDKDRFRRAVLDVAAPLHGLEKDDMEGEALRAQRRNLTWASSAAFVLAVALFFASLEWRTAVEEARNTAQQRDRALSRQLAAQARQRTTRPDLRLLLSMAALQVKETVEARRSLLDSVSDFGVPYRYLWGVAQDDLRNVEVTAVRATGGSAAGEAIVQTLTDRGVSYSWDLGTGKQLPPVLPGPEPHGRVYGIGSRFVSRTADKDTTILDVVTGQVILGPRANGGRTVVSDLAESADGNYLAVTTGPDATIELWSTRDRSAPLAVYRCRYSAYAASFSSDSKRLTAACLNELIIWPFAETLDRKNILHIELSDVDDLGARPQFSPGNALVAASVGNSIVLLRASDGRRIATLGGHSDNVRALAFRPTGRFLASAGLDGNVMLWDLSDRVPTRRVLSGHMSGVLALAWTADGRELVSSGENGTLMVWDLSGRSPGSTIESSFPIEDLEDNDAVMTPAGLVYLTSRGGIKRWDECAYTFRPLSGLDVKTLGDLYAESEDGSAFLLYRDDAHIATVAFRKESAPEWSFSSGSVPSGMLAIAPNGQRIAAVAGDRLEVFDVGTGAIRKRSDTNSGHTGSVEALVISSSGNLVASGGVDGTTNIFDVRSGSASSYRRDGFIYVRSLAFNAQETQLAIGYSSGEVQLWDLINHIRLGEPLRGHTRPVFALAYNPSGTILASGGGDKAVVLWDVESRSALSSPMILHNETIEGLAFSRKHPDELISIDHFHGMSILHFSDSVQSEIACKMANRAISVDEWHQYVGEALQYRPLCPIDSGL